VGTISEVGEHRKYGSRGPPKQVDSGKNSRNAGEGAGKASLEDLSSEGVANGVQESSSVVY